MAEGAPSQFKLNTELIHSEFGEPSEAMDSWRMGAESDSSSGTVSS